MSFGTKKKKGFRGVSSDQSVTAKAPLFVFAPGCVSIVGDVPHIIVAVKWNFAPMGRGAVNVQVIIGVKLTPAPIVMTADVAVNPVVPVPSVATIEICA